MIDRELIPALLSSPLKSQRTRGERLVFLHEAARTREWDGRHRPGPLDPRYFDIYSRPEPEEFEDEEFVD